MNNEILHVGCDALYVTFQACLSAAVLKSLARAKRRADKAGEQTYEVIGNISGHVFPNGAKGGYRYIFDQGPLAAKWLIKESLDPNQWNLFAYIPSQALAEFGLNECIENMLSDLKGWGAIILNNSVNRFDVCADIVAPNFKIDPNKIVAHSHSKIARHLDMDTNDLSPQIIGGNRIETVTIGKMPNRQIQIYDKRKEQIRTQKTFWFDLWGVARSECPVVWRVEVRAGKKSLDAWNIKTLDDLSRKIGDYCQQAFEDIKIVEERNETNVSRSVVSQFWIDAKTAIISFLSSAMSGAKKGKVREVIRKDQTQIISQLVVGLSANLGGLIMGSKERMHRFEMRGGGLAEFADDLASMVAGKIRQAAYEDSEKFFDKVRAVNQKYHFIGERESYQYG